MAEPTTGRYPSGVVDKAITALEAARPDTKEDGAVREYVDEALHYLYRLREIEDGIPHPYANAPSSGSPT